MLRFWLLVLLFFTGCSPQRYFYYPNRNLYADPDRFGVPYEIVQYPSLNGKKLTGLYFSTREPPKATIVHFHGNFGNVSNHFPLSLFLVKRGFDVLIFDYQGYGASEGSPSPRALVEDGIASVRFAQSRLRSPARHVAILGQSLGGAVGTVVAAKEPLVKGVVLEAAFAGYKTMARAALKRHWFTWPLSPVIPLFLKSEYDPLRWVDQIAPRPLLIVHGDRDAIVPVQMAPELFERARDPKELWIVQGVGHLEARRVGGPVYEDRLAQFFEAATK